MFWLSCFYFVFSKIKVSRKGSNSTTTINSAKNDSSERKKAVRFDEEEEDDEDEEDSVDRKFIDHASLAELTDDEDEDEENVKDDDADDGDDSDVQILYDILKKKPEKKKETDPEDLKKPFYLGDEEKLSQVATISGENFVNCEEFFDEDQEICRGVPIQEEEKTQRIKVIHKKAKKKVRRLVQ